MGVQTPDPTPAPNPEGGPTTSGLLDSTTRIQDSTDSGTCFFPSSKFIVKTFHKTGLPKDLNSQQWNSGDTTNGLQQRTTVAQFSGMQQGYAGMQQVYAGIQQGYAGMQQGYAGMQQSYDGIQPAYAGMQQTQYNFATQVTAPSTNQQPIVYQHTASNVLLPRAPITQTSETQYGQMTYFDKAVLTHHNLQAIRSLQSSGVHQPQLQDENAQPLKARTTMTRPISEAVLGAMVAWYEDNSHHPYPTRDEYNGFIATRGTTYKQALKWFANKRKRSGTCKPTQQITAGRREKPTKPTASDRGATAGLKRPHSSDNDSDVTNGQPGCKKIRKI